MPLLAGMLISRSAWGGNLGPTYRYGKTIPAGSSFEIPSIFTPISESFLARDVASARLFAKGTEGLGDLENLTHTPKMVDDQAIRPRCPPRAKPPDTAQLVICSANSLAYDQASGSSGAERMLDWLAPAGENTEHTACFCDSVRCRHSMLFSSWTRARCSASAFSFARSALSSASATSRAVTSLISLSTRPALMCIKNSPATPIATKPAPRRAQNNSQPLGLSGACIIPRPKSCNSWRYSMQITTSSTETPITTRRIQNFSQRSSDPQDNSRLLSRFRSVNSSIGRFQDDKLRAATVQMVAIVSVFLIAMAIILNQTAPSPPLTLPLHPFAWASTLLVPFKIRLCFPGRLYGYGG